MTATIRSYVVAGAAAATATTLAFTAVQPTPQDIAVPAHSTSSEPHLTQAMVDLLAAANRMTTTLVPHVPVAPGSAPAPGITPSAAVTGPVTAQPTALFGFPGAQNAIINTYDAVEPWVQYGFELAQYVAGWVPIVGWFAPQIGILYNFGEAIVQSVVYNVAYWIGGTVSFGQGVTNVVRDSINAGITLVNQELGWILPPLPPLPSSAIRTASAAAAPAAFESLSDALATGRQNIANATKGFADGGLVERVDSLLHALRPDTALTALRQDIDKQFGSLRERSRGLTKLGQVNETTTEADDVTTVPDSVRSTLQATDTTKPRTPRFSLRTTTQDRTSTLRARIKDTVDAAKQASEKRHEAFKAALKNAAPKAPKAKKTAAAASAGKVKPSAPKQHRDKHGKKAKKSSS